jgi:hypothetical protein
VRGHAAAEEPRSELQQQRGRGAACAAAPDQPGVLGLVVCPDSLLGDTLQHLRAPLSLRRCYVGRKGPDKQSSYLVNLGRHVDVVQSDWKH